MPYILRIERPELDPIVTAMGEKIDAPGKLAYILYAWFKRFVPRKFVDMALYTGAVVLTLFEIYRRIVARHEDGKIDDPLHGDVE